MTSSRPIQLHCEPLWIPPTLPEKPATPTALTIDLAERLRTSFRVMSQSQATIDLLARIVAIKQEHGLKAIVTHPEYAVEPVTCTSFPPFPSSLFNLFVLSSSFLQLRFSCICLLFILPEVKPIKTDYSPKASTPSLTLTLSDYQLFLHLPIYHPHPSHPLWIEGSCECHQGFCRCSSCSEGSRPSEIFVFSSHG